MLSYPAFHSLSFAPDAMTTANREHALFPSIEPRRARMQQAGGCAAPARCAAGCSALRPDAKALEEARSSPRSLLTGRLHAHDFLRRMFLQEGRADQEYRSQFKRRRAFNRIESGFIGQKEFPSFIEARKRWHAFFKPQEKLSGTNAPFLGSTTGHHANRITKMPDHRH